MRRRTLYTSMGYTPHAAFCSKSYDFGFVNKTRKTPNGYKICFHIRPYIACADFMSSYRHKTIL